MDSPAVICKRLTKRDAEAFNVKFRDHDYNNIFLKLFRLRIKSKIT